MDKEHIGLLQEKISAYLAFAKSGDIFEFCPNAKDRNIVIPVIDKHPLNQFAESFYKYLKKVVSEAGMNLKFELFKEDKS